VELKEQEVLKVEYTDHTFWDLGPKVDDVIDYDALLKELDS